GIRLYLYQMVDPRAAIFSKMTYNFISLLMIAFVSLGVYSLFLGNNPLQKGDSLMFLIGVVMGCMGFSTILTLVAGIASRTNNHLSITAILGFPVIIPFLKTLISYTQSTLIPFSRVGPFQMFMIMLFINIISIALAYILFPYLWRE
ncbi:MAG: hypothetical protein ABEH43_09200, partial [Flavobacteriales bacterium]